MAGDGDDEELVTLPFKFVTAGQSDSSKKAILRIYPDAAATTLDEELTRRRIQGFDARFPNQNQTKHCWQNYVDYQKCVLAKGDQFRPCRQFYHAYKSLCPPAWTARWDEQREKGTFPGDLE